MRRGRKNKTLLSEKGYVKRLNYFFFKRVVRREPVELECGVGFGAQWCVSRLPEMERNTL